MTIIAEFEIHIGWHDSSDANCLLVFSKIVRKDDNTQVVFSLEINQEFQWTLNIGGKSVLPEIMLNTPQRLYSLHNINTVFELLDSCRKFLPFKRRSVYGFYRYIVTDLNHVNMNNIIGTS